MKLRYFRVRADTLKIIYQTYRNYIISDRNKDRDLRIGVLIDNSPRYLLRQLKVVRDILRQFSAAKLAAVYYRGWRWGDIEWRSPLIVTARDLGFRSYPRTHSGENFSKINSVDGYPRNVFGFSPGLTPRIRVRTPKTRFRNLPESSICVTVCTPSFSFFFSLRSSLEIPRYRYGTELGLGWKRKYVVCAGGARATGVRSRKDLGYLADSGSSRRRRSTN